MVGWKPIINEREMIWFFIYYYFFLHSICFCDKQNGKVSMANQKRSEKSWKCFPLLKGKKPFSTTCAFDHHVHSFVLLIPLVHHHHQHLHCYSTTPLSPPYYYCHNITTDTLSINDFPYKLDEIKCFQIIFIVAIKYKKKSYFSRKCFLQKALSC